MSISLNRFNHKKIAILGFGTENRVFVSWIQKHNIECEMIICDQKKDLHLEYPEYNRGNISWNLGPRFDEKLERYDMVLRVPGYPLFKPEIKKALRAGVEVTSPTKLFFELSPIDNIIGVTGTKGKGTTSGLIYGILKTAGKKVYWGGNIGIPVFGFIDKLKKNDWVVLELSSFQLEDMAASPHIAVLTNLFREHLAPADPNNPNYHKNLAVYYQAKLNILAYQKKGDLAIINSRLKPVLLPWKKKAWLGKGEKFYFSKSDISSRLVGKHNQENIAAAVEVAHQLGIKESLIKKAVKKFEGLPHRIEYIGEARGVKYYDDSFGTTPESSIIALDSFTVPIILLAGGADKGANFHGFAKAIKKQVKFLVLFDGQATPRLKKELEKVNYPSNKIMLVKSMKEAIRIARTNSDPGDTVLLSTGCASFGMFNNYKDRGDQFKTEVKKLL